MEGAFRLRFLGTVQVEQDREPVRGFRSRKALALLAYLAVQDQPVPRERLADLFWEDEAEAHGRANLSWVLHRISTLLPGCLETDRHTVQFQRTDSHWSDTDAFEALEAQGEAASLAAAVELYRGEFLEGLYLDGCAEFELWLVGERERWRQRVARVLEALVTHHSRCGEYEQSLRFARHLLALEPWREEMHRQVMRLLGRNGQRVAALAQYETCRRVLAAELDVEPIEETSALYERFRAAGSVRRHNLPLQPTPFIGREEELAEIVKQLDDPDCRLLTLIGPGGIGKTRLALQAAAARTEAFLEGIYFIPLDDTSSVDSVVYAIADALQFSLSSPQDPQVQLLNALRRKEVLLVLDNFEHLLSPSTPPASGRKEGGVELLVEILQEAPEVKLLVTSRERLNVRWEWCFEIGGLEYPSGERANGRELESYSAVQLFRQTVRHVSPRFSLLPHDQPAVRHICQLVEGMPLGIELAAAWVGTHTCEEIAQEIERDLSFLTTSLRDLPERHRSMRATLEHSWRLLTPSEQHVLAQLAAFRRGFQAEAAGEIAGASPAVLQSLVAKSLLRLVSTGRYEMHELLRQYAAERLAAVPEAENEACDRHCVHYITFLQRQEATLAGPGAVEALAALKAETENVRAAWRRAVMQARVEEIARGLNGLSHLYLLAGPLQEGEMLIGMAADRIGALVGEADRPGRDMQVVLSRLLAERACFLNRLGRYEQAIAAARASIDLAVLASEAGQTAHPQAVAYLQWGRALLRQGEYETAQTRLEQALALACTVPLPQVEMDGLRSLGNVFHGRGDYARAGAYYEQTLHISRQLGDRWGESAALANLGLVSNQQGDYARARTCYEQASEISCEIGDRWGETLALINLGYVLHQQGHYAAARAYYRRTLHIAREIGDRQSESLTLACLGLLSHHLGDDEVACDYAQQALQIAQEIGDRHVQGYALTRLGHALAGRGHLSEAAEVYQQALNLRRELGQANLATETLAGLARVSMAQGNPVQAQAHIEAILSHMETGSLNGTDEPFQVYLTCHRVLRANQDPRAQAVLTTAHRLLQERAAQILSEAARRAFLENVTAHREIVEEIYITSTEVSAPPPTRAGRRGRR